MPKILVFDTETTDRAAKYPRNIKDLAKKNVEEKLKGKRVAKKVYERAIQAEYSKPEYLQYKPYIIQLSYIVYDLDEPENSKIFDKYIRIPKGVTVSPDAAKVNGIRYENDNRDIFTVKTDETGQEIERKKVKASKIASIREVIDEFIDDCETCDLLIGHNVQFDKERVLEELQRLEEEDKTISSVFFKAQREQKERIFNAKHALSLDERYYCTMQQSKSICKIQSSHPKAKAGTYKPPKLLEAYQTFFGYIPQDLHNALVDIITCLRVYMYIEHQGRDVCNENAEISKILRSKMSPEDRKRFPCGGPNRSDSIEEGSPKEKEGSSKELGSPASVPIVVEKRKSIWHCFGEECKKISRVFTRRKVHPTGGKRKTQTRKIQRNKK